MNQVTSVQPAAVEPEIVPLELPPPTRRQSRGSLLRELALLAAPVLAEQILHMFVGLNDTWLANHVVRLPAGASAEAIAAAHSEMSAAAAAVGTVSYILWFLGLMSGAVGTGATAIIARATGAKHRSLANSICGQ